MNEQILLLARQQDYLAQHPHLPGASANSSRRESFAEGQEESGHFAALPVKLLHGLKRNKSAVSSAVDLLAERRRRTSGNLGRSGGMGMGMNQSRPSLDTAITRRDSNSQGRASVFTEGSLTFSEAEGDSQSDPRRRSAIRFDLTDEPFRSDGTVDPAVIGDKAETGVQVVAETTRRVGKGHKSDNKSDCVVM